MGKFWDEFWKEGHKTVLKEWISIVWTLALATEAGKRGRTNRLTLYINWKYYEVENKWIKRYTNCVLTDWAIVLLSSRDSFWESFKFRTGKKSKYFFFPNCGWNYKRTVPSTPFYCGRCLVSQRCLHLLSKYVNTGAKSHAKTN